MKDFNSIKARIKELSNNGNTDIGEIQFSVAKEFGLTLESAGRLVILSAFSDAVDDFIRGQADIDELAGGAPSPNRGKNDNNRK